MGFFSSEKDNNVRKQYNGGSSPRPAGNNNAVDDAMRSSYPQASREQEKPVVDVVDFHETTDDTLKSKHTSQPVNTVKTPAQGSAKKGETFFAKEVNISGTLNSSTDIIIEGVFEGPIHTAGDVTVLSRVILPLPMSILTTHPSRVTSRLPVQASMARWLVM